MKTSSLWATAALFSAPSLAVLYDIPDELLQLNQPVSLTSGGHTAASKADVTTQENQEQQQACTYPGNFTVRQFATWTATANPNDTYVSFLFSDHGTKIVDAQCVRGPTSEPVQGLQTGLTSRWACTVGAPPEAAAIDAAVSFIWQQGSGNSNSTSKLTLLEVACPGQTNTIWEASGSVLFGNTTTSSELQCTETAEDWESTTGIGSGKGQLCKATTGNAPVEGKYSSIQPRPVKKTTSRLRHRRRIQ